MSVNVQAPDFFGDLRDDERGAVMLIGLCMACFLIGALWFLIGIGDAIVFRDTMQEATDHAAFTSAALHAKGMNFLAALNVVLLALVAIHILLGVIHDILLVVCIFTLGAACEPFPTARKIYTNYAKVMKKAMKAIGYVEKAAAYGYPYVAFAKGRGIGSDYGSHGARSRSIQMLPFSTSLVPGNSLVGPVNATFKTKVTPGDDKKAGLPVTPKPWHGLCEKIGQVGVDALISHTGLGLGLLTKGPFKSLVGDAIHLRYCNALGMNSMKAKLLQKFLNMAGKEGEEEASGKDSDKEQDKVDLSKDPGKDKGSDTSSGAIDPGFDPFWGDKGYFVPWSGTANGNPFQQVWAVNMRPSYSDTSEHAVGIASGRLGLGQTAKPHSYYAQAEFYFDCAETWTHKSCDGDDNAGFAIKWRARMRRFDNDALKLTGALAGPISAGLKAADNIGDTLAKVPGVGDSISGALDSMSGAVEDFQNTVNGNPLLAKPYH